MKTLTKAFDEGRFFSYLDAQAKAFSARQDAKHEEFLRWMKNEITPDVNDDDSLTVNGKLVVTNLPPGVTPGELAVRVGLSGLDLRGELLLEQQRLAELVGKQYEPGGENPFGEVAPALALSDGGRHPVAKASRKYARNESLIKGLNERHARMLESRFPGMTVSAAQSGADTSASPDEPVGADEGGSDVS